MTSFVLVVTEGMNLALASGLNFRHVTYLQAAKDCPEELGSRLKMEISIQSLREDDKRLICFSNARLRRICEWLPCGRNGLVTVAPRKTNGTSLPDCETASSSQIWVC